MPDEVIKVAELQNGLKVAELFHGPTLAFKDLALGVVGGLYNYFLTKSKKKCIVLVGKKDPIQSVLVVFFQILLLFFRHLWRHWKCCHLCCERTTHD